MDSQASAQEKLDELNRVNVAEKAVTTLLRAATLTEEKEAYAKKQKELESRWNALYDALEALSVDFVFQDGRYVLK